MQDGISYPPLFQGMSIVKGFIAGSLVAIGIFSPLGWLVQIILIAAGVVVFLDAIIPEGEVSIIATVFAAIIGGFASGLFSIIGLGIAWTGVTIALAVAVYYMKMLGRRRK